MPKTRLNNADREQIAEANIAHKYDALALALIRREAALANEAYDRLYSVEMQKKMAAVGPGAFATDDDIRVAVNGQKYDLDFNAVRRDYDLGIKSVANDPERIQRPFLSKDCKGYDPVISVLDSDDFGARLAQFLQDRTELQKDRPDMLKKLGATLDSFRYFDDLVTAFPEAQEFIMKRWRERPEGGSPGVPAVVIKDLAAQLDLPPPAKAA